MGIINVNLQGGVEIEKTSQGWHIGIEYWKLS